MKKKCCRQICTCEINYDAFQSRIEPEAIVINNRSHILDETRRNHGARVGFQEPQNMTEPSSTIAVEQQKTLLDEKKEWKHFKREAEENSKPIDRIIFGSDKGFVSRFRRATNVDLSTVERGEKISPSFASSGILTKTDKNELASELDIKNKIINPQVKVTNLLSTALEQEKREKSDNEFLGEGKKTNHDAGKERLFQRPRGSDFGSEEQRHQSVFLYEESLNEIPNSAPADNMNKIPEERGISRSYQKLGEYPVSSEVSVKVDDLEPTTRISPETSENLEIENQNSKLNSFRNPLKSSSTTRSDQDHARSTFQPDVTYFEEGSKSFISSFRISHEKSETDSRYSPSENSATNEESAKYKVTETLENPKEVPQPEPIEESMSFDNLISSLSHQVSEKIFKLKEKKRIKAEMNEETYIDEILNKVTGSAKSKIVENLKQAASSTQPMSTSDEQIIYSKASEDIKPFENTQALLLHDVLGEISENKKQKRLKADVADKTYLYETLNHLAESGRTSEKFVKPCQSSESGDVPDVSKQSRQRLMKAEMNDIAHLKEVLNREESDGNSVTSFEKSVKLSKDSEIFGNKSAESTEVSGESIEGKQRRMRTEMADLTYLKNILNQEASGADSITASEKPINSESFNDVQPSVSDEASESDQRYTKIGIADKAYLKEIISQTDAKSFEKFEAWQVKPDEGSDLFATDVVSDKGSENKQKRSSKIEIAEVQYLKEVDGANSEAPSSESISLSEKSEPSEDSESLTNSSITSEVTRQFSVLNDCSTHLARSYSENNPGSFTSSFSSRQKSESKSDKLVSSNVKESKLKEQSEFPRTSELNDNVNFTPPKPKRHLVSSSSSFISRSENTKSNSSNSVLLLYDDSDSELLERKASDGASASITNSAEECMRTTKKTNEVLQTKSSENREPFEISLSPLSSRVSEAIAENKIQRIRTEISDEAYLNEIFSHMTSVGTLDKSKDLENKPFFSLEMLGDSFSSVSGGATFKNEKEKRIHADITDKTYLNEILSHAAKVNEDKVSKNAEEQQNFFENYSSSLDHQVSEEYSDDDAAEEFNDLDHDYSQDTSKHETKTFSQSQETGRSTWSPAFEPAGQRPNRYSRHPQTNLDLDDSLEIASVNDEQIVYRDKKRNTYHIDKSPCPSWATFKSAFKISRITNNERPYWVYLNLELLFDENKMNDRPNQNSLTSNVRLIQKINFRRMLEDSDDDSNFENSKKSRVINTRKSVDVGSQAEDVLESSNVSGNYKKSVNGFSSIHDIFETAEDSLEEFDDPKSSIHEVNNNRSKNLNEFIRSENAETARNIEASENVRNIKKMSEASPALLDYLQSMMKSEQNSFVPNDDGLIGRKSIFLKSSRSKVSGSDFVSDDLANCKNGKS